jgi:hypothetical protein
MRTNPKRNISLFFLWIYTAIFCNYASSQDFELIISDTAEQQTANGFSLDNSGKIWLGGTKLPIGGSDLIAWLYKIGKNGQIEKRFQFPFSGYQTWVGSEKLPSGKIAAVIGQKNSIGLTENWIAILDSNSLISFQKIEGADNAILDEISITKSGNLLICGFKAAPGAQGINFWLSKLNPENAEIQWTYENGISPNDHIQSAIECKNGDIVFCGDVQLTSYNPFISRLDSNGQFIWDLVVETPWNDGSQNIIEDSIGNFWMVGESSTAAGSFFDTELTKVSSNGILLWQEWLGSEGQDAAFIIKKAETNGFWVGGYSNASTQGVGPISPFLMRMDRFGNSLGEHFFPFNSPSPVYDMEVIGDSTFYFCGITNNSAFFIKKTNPPLQNSFVVSNQVQSVKKPNVSIRYDFENEILTFENGRTNSISIFETTGKLIYTQTSRENRTSISGLAKGVYILKMENDAGTISTMFVK